MCWTALPAFTPIQNKLMQKLMLYAKKVMVTVTIDERENPYHVEGEHQLFYLSKKTVAGLKRLAQEVNVREEEPIWVHPGEKSRFAAGGELWWLEQNLFRLRWQRYPQEPTGYQTSSTMRRTSGDQPSCSQKSGGRGRLGRRPDPGADSREALSLPGFCPDYRRHGELQPGAGANTGGL
ncbi:MAG: hypothetical protein V8Q40_11210 [Anaerosacchariphilus sp.]